MCVDCDILTHTWQPLEAKEGEIPGFEGLTSFKKAHTPECRGCLQKYLEMVHFIVKQYLLILLFEGSLTSNTPKKAHKESITELHFCWITDWH